MKFWFITAAIWAVAGDALAQPKYYAGTNLWKAEIGYRSQSSPTLDANGIIYVTTWNGWLHAINPDGTRRWRFKIGFESVSTPAIGNDGMIVFGARNRRIYAVDPAGRSKWDFRTGGWVDASPAVGIDGTVYVGSWDKKFYALDSAGMKKWEFPTGGPIVSSAAIDPAGTIYFGSHDRTFYALNPDGTKRWEFATRGAITSSPAIGGEGEIYFSSVDGKLHALNSDGTRRWELQTGGFTPSSPVLGADGTIYLSVNTNHCAVSAEGKLKWQRGFWNLQPGFFGESAAAVLANGLIMFTGGDGYLMVVPPEDADREWVWNYWLFGASYSSPLVAPDGTIYGMGTSHELHAIQGSVPLATSSWPMFRGNPKRTGRVAGN